MSVMECDRKGCKNIMCDILILDNTRYICSECFNEMQEDSKKWLPKMSKIKFNLMVVNFMHTEKIYKGEEFNTSDLIESLLPHKK